MKKSGGARAGPRRGWFGGWLRAAAAGALLAWPLLAGAQSLFGLSPQDEKRFGREQHPKVVAQFGGAYDDPALARYVDSIGQFLAAASHAPRVGYTFTVLDSPVVNAFALPGGYVYVTRGLLALADNEAEVAGGAIVKSGVRRVGHAAALLSSMSSIPSLNRTPWMTFASCRNPRSRRQDFSAHRPIL